MYVFETLCTSWPCSLLASVEQNLLKWLMRPLGKTTAEVAVSHMTVNQVEPLERGMMTGRVRYRSLCWWSWIHFSHSTDSWSFAAEKSHYAKSFQSTKRNWQKYFFLTLIVSYSHLGFISMKSILPLPKHWDNYKKIWGPYQWFFILK